MSVASTMSIPGNAATGTLARSGALIDAKGIVKIYPTVSGEPVLALVPIVPFLAHAPRDLTIRRDHELSHRRRTHFESAFAVPVQVIVFLFAFVNVGIGLHGFGTGTWAVALASLIGRPIGTLAAIGLAILAGLSLPDTTDWRQTVVAALAATPIGLFGVLFAVSILPVGPVLVQTKLGAIATVAGLLPAFAAARLLSVERRSV